MGLVHSHERCLSLAALAEWLCVLRAGGSTSVLGCMRSWLLSYGLQRARLSTLILPVQVPSVHRGTRGDHQAQALPPQILNR